MSTEQRTAIVRWVLGGITAIGSILLFDQLRGLSVQEWLLLASLALLAALIENLGVRVSYGYVTLMPVMALMAYFAFGRDPSFAVVIVGLVLGGIVQIYLVSRRGTDRAIPWWRRISQQVLPIARNGLALIATDWAYRTYGAPVPLTSIATREAVLGAILAPVIYVMVHDALLAVDLWLQGLPVIRTLRKNWRTMLAMQILPLALAPFSAIALWQLGDGAFLLFEIILLATAIVVNRLTIAQETLKKQVTQLSTFSAMSETLRTSLDVDSLLATLYAQVASLLGVRNLHVYLSEGTRPNKHTRLAFASESGVRVERPDGRNIDGLTQHVIKQDDGLLAETVDQTGARLGLTNLPHARSWMGVPLRASNQTLGVMVTWISPAEQGDRVFTPNDMLMFNALSAQAGVTLENALLYSAAQKHAAQLARLNQISTVMNASLNPERVLELIAESVIEVAGCDKAAIYLLESEARDPSLILTHAQGFSSEHVARSRDIAVLNEDERKKVIEEGKTIAVSNLHGDGIMPSPVTLLLAQREDFSAYAYLPLRAQKQPIGMLAVYYTKPHTFDASEIELLETFANQAALAVVNARVYQRVDVQLARRVEQIVQMADINQRLTSTLNLEQVFTLIIDSAMEGCEASRGVLLLLGDPEQGQEHTGLNMVAWRGFDPTRSMRMPHHVAEELADSPVLKEGETILVSGDDASRSMGPRSQLSVPIVVEDRVIGAIALESEALNAFTSGDVTFVSQLAVQAAVTIRNAQLYKRAQVVRDRLHAILDASSDGLLMIDSKSRIVMTNARMGDFWDFAREDYNPRSPEEFIADPLTALGEGLGYREGELLTMLESAMRNPQMRMTTDLYVTRAVTGNQRQRFVERSVAPVHDEEDSFLGLLLIFRDVTKQKELEQTREDLTNMIVHDLRSPLQAVMGSMRLISEVVSRGEKNPVIDQATSVSGRAVKKLLNLVNNLLDLSRLERGEFTLDPTSQPVKPMLEDAAAELMPLAQEMDAVVRVEAADDLPSAHMDRDMIARVVLNLLDNALKYSPPGALVTLRSDVFPGDKVPGSTRKESMVRIQVMDTGPGVPDHYKDLIFDRYTQIPGQKGRRASAGLGLAFCRLAVESHNGKIWVENNPEGKGSVFTFVLPIARPGGPPEKRLTASTTADSPAPAPAPARLSTEDDPLKTRTDISVDEVRKYHENLKEQKATPEPKAEPESATDPLSTEPAVPTESIEPPGTEPMISREEFRKRAAEADAAEKAKPSEEAPKDDASKPASDADTGAQNGKGST